MFEIIIKCPWFYRFVMCFIISMVLASTSYDIWVLTLPGGKLKLSPIPADLEPLSIQVLHCFSLIRNLHEWLKDSGDREMGCVNGIRAISSLLTVNFHAMVVIIPRTSISQTTLFQVLKNKFWLFPFSNKIF